MKKSLSVFAGVAMGKHVFVPAASSEAGSVTLEEKIGQMLMVGFRGLRIDKNHSIVRDIQDTHIGGVVLFDYDVPSRSPVRNIGSPSQIKKLVEQLQFYADIPLFVAIDYEGGRVSRLKEEFGFAPTYSAQYFGEKNDLSLTFKHAEDMAKLLASLGINLNLAPVVDLNTNPDNPVIGRLERSYSEDSEKVVSHAERFIQAFHRNHVFCTLKHFPGHGSSEGDSHLGMVDVSQTWDEVELVPYRQLIQKEQVDAVMTAHVYNEHLDSEYPATLSKRIITDLLRKKLLYNGIVISDDLQMGAITKEYGLESAIFKAVEAGVDILVFANNSTFDASIALKAAGLLNKLIQTQKISSERIDESYERIMKLKKEVNHDREA